jgi:hypothetical protein
MPSATSYMQRQLAIYVFDCGIRSKLIEERNYAAVALTSGDMQRRVARFPLTLAICTIVDIGSALKYVIAPVELI